MTGGRPFKTSSLPSTVYNIISARIHFGTGLALLQVTMRALPRALPISLLAISVSVSSAAFAQAAAPQSADSTQATSSQPIQQSHEGFWGHMNPFARKKWVKRQVDPIKERENELDYVTAKNTNDIRDTDARATAGIRRASDAANAANQAAVNAGNTARNAQGTADQASAQAASLRGTVNGLDNYSQTASVEIRFAAGSATLGPTARRKLDEFAQQLANDKGYVLQVQGFTAARGTAGAALSEKMADSVERYLVAKHDVSLYRISKLGYGSVRPADLQVPRGSVVEVTLLHNSLAALSQSSPATGSDIGATQTSNSAPSPGTSASHPNATTTASTEP